MKTIVAVKNLSHRYSKDWAIKDINFEIHQRGVLGLLGSNGAGKSTTMNIMCGVLDQTQGEVFINGINLRDNPLEAKKHIGFLPQQAPLHLELTVDEYLTHCGRLRSLESSELKTAIQRVKSKCGIAHFSHRLISNLSGGYRQRVGIAQAIIHNPALVVLDEPTNGLDPNQVKEVRKLIKEIAQERSVILSTHILPEVEACCDSIKMVELGKMVFSGSIDEFNNYIKPHSMILKCGKPPSLDVICAIEGVTNAESINNTTIRFYFNGDQSVSNKLVQASVQQGWILNELSFERSSLEEVFAALSSNKNHPSSEGQPNKANQSNIMETKS